MFLTLTQIEGRCYCCGKYGHKLPQYKLKDSKPKSEWFTNTVQLIQTKRTTSNDNYSAKSTTNNSSEYNNDSTITSKSSSKKIGWSNLHYNLRNCNLEKKKTSCKI